MFKLFTVALITLSVYAGDGSLPDRPDSTKCYEHVWTPPVIVRGAYEFVIRPEYSEFNITEAVWVTESIHVDITVPQWGRNIAGNANEYVKYTDGVYETVEVYKMITPASVVETVIPAETVLYEVESTETPAKMEWVEIPCEG